MRHAEERADSSSSRTTARVSSRRRFLASLGMFAGAGALVPLAARTRRREPARLEAARPMLGTWVRVVARHPDASRAERAIERAFAAFRETDAQMSVHRQDSDLARVNAAAGRAAVAAPAALRAVVTAACETARRSGGVYDPTVLPLMRTWGFYGAPRASRPATAEVDRALELTDWSGVRVDDAAGTVALNHAGAGLDLGSLGKGWAVDAAIAAMRAEGIADGLVDAGGKVFAMGVPAEGEDGWAVGLLHPVTGRTVRVFTLRDQAVATSGNTERFVTLGGVRIGHLFDARRGRPADGHLAASVLARRALDADRLCTAAFLIGPSNFKGWPDALDSVFVD